MVTAGLLGHKIGHRGQVLNRESYARVLHVLDQPLQESTRCLLVGIRLKPWLRLNGRRTGGVDTQDSRRGGAVRQVQLHRNDAVLAGAA